MRIRSLNAAGVLGLTSVLLIRQKSHHGKANDRVMCA
jgi:hypothetical protein